VNRRSPRHSQCKPSGGDIVNIDVTLILNGWHGDTSRMYAVGHISRRAERLIEVTYEALMRGVAAVKPGHTTGHIGAAIQSYAEGERCGVVRDFCGHGLGRVFHDRPNILHYGEPGDGVVLEPGMLFTIEPMINLGKPHVKILPDGWSGDARPERPNSAYGRGDGDGLPGVHDLARGVPPPPMICRDRSAGRAR
jgi:methionyl aminopeptidase